jgi:membrane protein DedA with SNARE-associated domain
MVGEGLEELVFRYVEQFNYAGPFVALLLCGVGLPMPEEVPLLASGALVHRNAVSFVPITLTCSVAILLGDSLPFWLGRLYGMRALQIRTVRRVLHPERFARFEAKFQRHGDWATFFLRFLPGLRIPGYFVAGTMRMNYLRFLAIDAAGVLLSVPVSIWFGALAYRALLEHLKSGGGAAPIAVAVVLVAAAALIVRKLTRRASPPPVPDRETEPTEARTPPG